MPKMSIRKQMLVDVARTYQVSSQTFKLCEQDIPIYLEDVRDIAGLQIEGTDVDEYIRKRNISEEKTVQSALFQRFADADNKLDLFRLEGMISDETTPDEDFKRAFVLFTIGVILASTTVPYVNFSYIQVVEHVSLIRKFNWGQFTLNNLLDSCDTYITQSESTLKGNLALLQCWYWERVIVEDSGVKYDNRIQPRIVMWTEKNASARVNAFMKKGLHRGTLMLSRHTTHQKYEPPVASMSQVRQSKYAHDEYMINPPVAEEGLSNQQGTTLGRGSVSGQSSSSKKNINTAGAFKEQDVVGSHVLFVSK